LMRAANDIVGGQPRIVYIPLFDAKPEQERDVLANIYSSVLRHANKNAPGVTSTKGDDAKGSRLEVRANEASIPR
jgi:hypothetical protein